MTRPDDPPLPDLSDEVLGKLASVSLDEPPDDIAPVEDPVVEAPRGKAPSSFEDYFQVVSTDGRTFYPQKMLVLRSVAHHKKGKAFGCKYENCADIFLLCNSQTVSYVHGVNVANGAEVSIEEVPIYAHEPQASSVGPSHIACLNTEDDTTEYAVICGKTILRLQYDAELLGFQSVHMFTEIEPVKELRGIATARERKLVFTFSSPMILCIDGHGDGQVLSRTHYGINERRGFGNVCYMDYNDKQRTLVTSDLGFGSFGHNSALLRKYSVDENFQLTKICEYVSDDRVVNELQKGAIQYASGIMIDDAGWVLVADAKKPALHLFDDQLRPLCHIRLQHEFQQPFPFTTSITLSEQYAALNCVRKGRTYFYELKDRPTQAQFAQRPRRHTPPKGQKQSSRRGSGRGREHRGGRSSH
ncbi:unnamed protein product, partial [Mesorhabditis spiculigera]